MKGSTALKLISIGVLLALFSTEALAQSPSNATQVIESANITDTADQSSVPAGTRDVTKLANLSQIFTANKSEALKIYNVNHASDSWVEIYNSGITPRNLTGWTLTNKENSQLVLPKLDLSSGASIRVHPGTGVSRAADLYLNSTSPMWMDSNSDVITLHDNTGRTIFTYTY